MLRYILLFVGVCLLQVAIAQPLSPYTEDHHGIHFVENAESWQAVIELSKAENKPIFVDVYTEWCGPCKWMDQNVFNQAEVGEFMNREFINVKLDAEKGWGPAFKTTFGVAAYPTYLYFDPAGDLIFSGVGSANAEDFLKQGGERALANLKSGVSVKGLERLLGEETRDLDKFKEYMTLLAGNRPSTSYLLDRYLEFLPEDSLTTDATIDLIKSHLAAPVNVHSKGFQLLVHAYRQMPVRNNFLNSSWNSIKSKLLSTVESDVAKDNHVILEDIVALQDQLYPPELAELYKGYYKAYYYAYTREENLFVENFNEFLRAIYRPDDLKYLIAFDENEYKNAVKLETEAAAPAILSAKRLDDLRRFHNGVARGSSDLLFAVYTLYITTFPESFDQYNKEFMIKALSFTNDLYSSNNVHVNNNLVQRNVKLLDRFKLK